jgi:hypothetical protein
LGLLHFFGSEVIVGIVKENCIVVPYLQVFASDMIAVANVKHFMIIDIAAFTVIIALGAA